MPGIRVRRVLLSTRWDRDEYALKRLLVIGLISDAEKHGQNKII